MTSTQSSKMAQIGNELFHMNCDYIDSVFTGNEDGIVFRTFAGSRRMVCTCTVCGEIVMDDIIRLMHKRKRWYMGCNCSFRDFLEEDEDECRPEDSHHFVEDED